MAPVNSCQASRSIFAAVVMDVDVSRTTIRSFRPPHSVAVDARGASQIQSKSSTPVRLALSRPARRTRGTSAYNERVRLAALLVATSACGRFGFEPTAGRDGGAQLGDDSGAMPDAEGMSLDATVFPDGMVAAGCGSTELLRDDFDVAGPAPLFMEFTANGLTIDELGGQWNITFASNVGAGRYAGYSSVATYAADGLCASIESVAVPNPSGVMYFKLSGGDEQIEFFLIDSFLRMRTQKGSQVAILAQIAFDPVQQRFWRLRNQGGTTSWDTSPDNINFVSHVSTTFLTVTQLFFEHGGGAVSSVSNGGTGSFDQALATGP